MNSRLNKIPAFALILGLLPLTAAATPTLGPNGHYYEVIAGDGIGWVEADGLASGMNYLGADGHLATLTSEAENNFVDSLRLASDSNKDGFENSELWVGGNQPIAESAAGDGWVWVNGEGSITTFYWLPGEPNDAGGSESHLAIGWSGEVGWNDEANLNGLYGYIVEYEIIARDDAAEASSGVPKNINVIGNDTLASGAVVVTIESSPVNISNSAVANPDNSVTYTADSTFEGIDTFTYRVTVNGFYAIATVTVVVAADRAVLEIGVNVPMFNQALNPAPGSVNPLTASWSQVVAPGVVTGSCCLVKDEREGAGKKALGYYLPVDFDIGLAILTQARPDCVAADMAAKIPPGSAIMRPWHRGVPASQGIYDPGDPVIAGPNDLGVCVFESTAKGDFVFSVEQAKNLLGYKVNYSVPTLQYRPITAGVALDPLEVDSPYLTSWTADTDESRSAKKYSKNVMVVNAWHAWLFNPSRPYLSQMADAILDSIEDARVDNVDGDFLNKLKSHVQKAKAYIWLPSKTNAAIKELENATRLALLIPTIPLEVVVDNPYSGSTENWKGLWVGRTMALKFAVCSELKHTFSSSSTLQGACLIAPDILAEMPDLPGF
jgi:Bacterial Ig domain